MLPAKYSYDNDPVAQGLKSLAQSLSQQNEQDLQARQISQTGAYQQHQMDFEDQQRALQAEQNAPVSMGLARLAAGNDPELNKYLDVQQYGPTGKPTVEQAPTFQGPAPAGTQVPPEKQAPLPAPAPQTQFQPGISSGLNDLFQNRAPSSGGPVTDADMQAKYAQSQTASPQVYSQDTLSKPAFDTFSALVNTRQKNALEAAQIKYQNAKADQADAMADKLTGQAGAIGGPDPKTQIATKKFVSQSVQSARGDDTYKIAKNNVAQADKMESIFNDPKYSGNLDLLPQASVNTAVLELTKLASGQAPTEAEFKGLSPSTYGQFFQNAKAKFGDPTPANVGAYLQNMRDYAKQIRSDAQDVIENKHRDAITPFKRDLGDNNFNDLVEANPFRTREQVAAGWGRDKDGRPIPPSTNTATTSLNPSQQRIMATAPAAPKGYVTIYKNGAAVGHVPQENLEKAKAQGFSETP